MSDPSTELGRRIAQATVSTEIEDTLPLFIEWDTGFSVIWILDGDRDFLKIVIREDPGALDSIQELSRYTGILLTANQSPATGKVSLLTGYMLRGAQGIAGTSRTYSGPDDITVEVLAQSLNDALWRLNRNR